MISTSTIRQPVSAVRGTTVYRYEGQRAVNWSHYSATCIDPSDPDLLWTLQAYANSDVDQQWCTAWAAFRLRDTKQPNPDQTMPTARKTSRFNVDDLRAHDDLRAQSAGIADDTPAIKPAIPAAAK